MSAPSTFHVFGFNNLATHQIDPQWAEPWRNAPPIPAKFKDDRTGYKRWLASPDSVVPLFSAVEGENPHQRVGSANPAFRVHGVVADYDAVLTEAEVIAAIGRIPPQYPPFAYNRTRRGGLRIIWAFDKPVFYYGSKTYHLLMSRVAKELDLRGLAPGFDEKALNSADQTYAAGDSWVVPGGVIGEASVSLWVFDSVRRTTDFDREGIEIPFEVLEKAVAEKFPGRWSGPFREGARGLRFWDPSADNPTAVVVRKTGCTCYTGDRPFMSWSDIFGREFVTKYQEDRIGRAVSEMYSGPGRKFFRQMPDQTWDGCDLMATRLHLRMKYGLSDSTPKGALASEVDQVVHHLEMTRRISGLIPFPHVPQQVVEWNGKTWLNCSQAQLVRPADAGCDPTGGDVAWGHGFPFLSGYLATLFHDLRNLEVFLLWLQTWYKGCLAGQPQQGHALFIVGPPGTGKSFLSLEVMSSIFGGYANAAKHFVEDSHFNDSIFEKALWALDDQTILGDARKHRKFSALVKACVANPSMPYAAKYGYEGEAPFWGRFVATLNDDPVSLGIIPDTGLSLLDKVVLLRTSDIPADVSANRRQNHETVVAELPYFLRWLINWTPTTDFEMDSRFGFKATHDAATLDEVKSVSDTAVIEDALAEWWSGHEPDDDREKIGFTSTELVSLLQNDDKTRAAMRNMTPVYFGRLVNQLIANGSKWISRRRRTTGNQGYAYFFS